MKHSKQLIAGIADTLLVGLGVAATLRTWTMIVDAAALRAANVAALTTGADLLPSFQGAGADQRGMDCVRAALQVGFYRYLTKPIKVTELMETLDVALKFATPHWGATPNRSRHDTFRI